MKNIVDTLTEIARNLGNGFDVSEKPVEIAFQRAKFEPVSQNYWWTNNAEKWESDEYPNLTLMNEYTSYAAGEVLISIFAYNKEFKANEAYREFIHFLVRVKPKESFRTEITIDNKPWWIKTSFGTVDLIGHPLDFYTIKPGETIGECAQRIFDGDRVFLEFIEEAEKNSEILISMDCRERAYEYKSLFSGQGDYSEYVTFYAWINGVLSEIGKKFDFEEVCAYYSYAGSEEKTVGSLPGIVGALAFQNVTGEVAENLYSILKEKIEIYTKERKRIFDISSKYGVEINKLMDDIRKFAIKRSDEYGIDSRDINLNMELPRSYRAPQYYIDSNDTEK